jgi:uncharacterized protein YbjT (DUF2867 family)
MILVSGGTGVIGSAVVAELQRRGESVAVLGRDAQKIRRQFGSDVEAREGNVRDPATLVPAMTGADVVVDAVQFPNYPIESPRQGYTFEEVDYKGAVNQVNAAKEAGVRRYVYLSGVGAAPDAAKHWFRFKWMAEQHLVHSGLEWTVIRPTWVFGPRDTSMNRLLGFTRFLPFLPLFGDGKQPMQPVFIDDVGRVVAEAALSSACANQLLELGGPEVMSMNEVLKTGLEVMGRKRPILHAPVFAGKAAGKVLQVLPKAPLSADAVEFVITPAVADTTNLQRLLQPELTPLRQGLETYLGKRS